MSHSPGANQKEHQSALYKQITAQGPRRNGRAEKGHAKTKTRGCRSGRAAKAKRGTAYHKGKRQPTQGSQKAKARYPPGHTRPGGQDPKPTRGRTDASPSWRESPTHDSGTTEVACLQSETGESPPASKHDSREVPNTPRATPTTHSGTSQKECLKTRKG